MTTEDDHVTVRRHHAAVRAEEIDRRLGSIDIYAPYKEAISESERVEKNYGSITGEYSDALTRAKERAVNMESLVKSIQSQALNVLRREEQEFKRIEEREEEVMHEKEEDIEVDVHGDEEEMVALTQEEEIFMLETRRCENIHRATVARLEAHRRTAAKEFGTMIDELNRRAAEKLAEVDTEEQAELDRIKHQFDDWKYEQDAEFAKQRQVKYDAGDTRKKQKRLPLDDAEAVVASKRQVLDKHQKQCSELKLEMANYDAQQDTMRPDLEAAALAAEGARREATLEGDAHKRMLEEFLREKEDQELQLAKALQDEREIILTKRKEAQAELRLRLQEAQERFKDKTDALQNMIQRVDNRQRKRNEDESYALRRIQQMKDELQQRISDAPMLERKIQEVLEDNESMPGRLRRQLQDYQDRQEESFADRERQASSDHSSRLIEIRGRRSTHEDEYRRRVAAERQVVQERVDKVMAQFSPFLAKQGDARAAALALVQSCTARTVHLNAEKAAIRDRHSKLVGDYETDWGRRRARERRRLDDLTRSRGAVEEQRAAYVLESEHKLDELKKALQEEEQALNQDEDSIRRDGGEAQQLRKETREAEEAALRSRFASRKAELLGRRRELATLYEPLSLDRNLAPLEQASTALDTLEAEIKSKESACDEDEVSVRQLESDTDTRMQQEAEATQMQIRDVQVDIAERLSQIRRDLETDKIRLTGERDSLLKAIEVRVAILKNKANLLENAAKKMRDESRQLAAQATAQDEISELNVDKLARQQFPELDDDLSLDDHTKRARFDDRAMHRLAVIGILVERARHADGHAAAELLEMEAQRLEAEAGFLREDITALESRSERIGAIYGSRLEARERESLLAQESLQEDADELQRGMDRLLESKKVYLHQSVVDRKNRLEVIKSKLRALKEEAIRQTRNLDNLAQEVSYNVKRTGDAKKGMKELRKVEMELQFLIREEEKAATELKQRWAEEDAKMDKETSGRMREIGQKKYLMGPRRAYLMRETEIVKSQVQYLTALLDRTVQEHANETARVTKLEGERQEILTRERQRAARSESVVQNLVSDTQSAMLEAQGHLEEQDRLWKELDGEYKNALAVAQNQQKMHEIEKWNSTIENAFVGEEASSEQRMNSELESVRADRKELKEELKRRQIAIEQAILDGELRLEASRRAVPDNAARIEELQVLITEALESEEAASQARHEEDSADLKDLTGMKGEHAMEIGAVQAAAEAEYRVKEEAIDLEEADRMEKIAERQRALELHLAAESSSHRAAKERVEILKGRAEELEEQLREREKRFRAVASQRDEVLHKLAVVEEQAMQSEADLKGKEAIADEVRKVVNAEFEVIEAEVKAEVDVIDGRRRQILDTKVREVRADLDRIEALYKSRKDQIEGLHRKEVSDVERQRDDEIKHIMADEADAQRELERMKGALEKASLERAEQRRRKRDEVAKTRLAKRRLASDADARHARRYHRDMTNALRSLEDQWALLLSNLEDERKKLEEERDKEIRRLEAREKSDLEAERRRREKEAQEDFDRRQAAARLENERMREAVLAELRRMEEESRLRLMEEMKKLQMLQLMMQQEALQRLDTTMQSRLQQIESSRRQHQEELERTYLQEQIRLKEDMLLREQERLSKLASAWATSKANTRRNVAEGQLVLEGREKVQKDIAELARKEEELMLAEQRKVEAEMAAVEKELHELQRLQQAQDKAAAARQASLPAVPAAGGPGGGGTAAAVPAPAAAPAP